MEGPWCTRVFQGVFQNAFTKIWWFSRQLLFETIPGVFQRKTVTENSFQRIIGGCPVSSTNKVPRFFLICGPSGNAIARLNHTKFKIESTLDLAWFLWKSVIVSWDLTRVVEFLLRNISVCDKLTDFECANGKCIPIGWECNYEDDCGDASDEHYMANVCHFVLLVRRSSNREPFPKAYTNSLWEHKIRKSLATASRFPKLIP